MDCVGTLLRCQAFLKGESVPAPVIVAPDFFALMVGTLLSSQDVSSALVMKEGKVQGAMYGYQVIKFIMEGGSDSLYQRLYTQMPMDSEVIPLAQIPTATGLDQCETVLAKVAERRFGDVLVISTDNDPIGVVSLRLMVRLLSLKGKCKMKLKELASPVRLITGNETVSATLNFMMSYRIRRVVFKRNSTFYCCTEREFLRGMFSMDGLDMMRNNPKVLLDQKVESFAMDRAAKIPVLDGNRKVEEAWELCAQVPTATAIVNGDMIATPWDMVIKPFIERKLEFA